MYINVTVERMAENKLSNKIWRFTLIDTTLVLDSFVTVERTSLRHKFRRVEYYSRLDQRGNTLTKEEVLFPQEVKTEALAGVFEQITVAMELPQ